MPNYVKEAEKLFERFNRDGSEVHVTHDAATFELGPVDSWHVVRVAPELDHKGNLRRLRFRVVFFRSFWPENVHRGVHAIDVESYRWNEQAPLELILKSDIGQVFSIGPLADEESERPWRAWREKRDDPAVKAGVKELLEDYRG